MGRIQYTSQVSALTGRSNSPLRQANTDPNAFGANVGRATQELGQAVGQAGQAAYEVDQRNKEKERREKLASFIATRDYTSNELAMRNDPGVEGDDYVDRARDDYINWVEKQVEDLDDDALRSEARTSLLRDAPNVTSRAAQFQFQSRAEMSKDRGDSALNALQNKISLDPSQYDKFRDEGANVIDALPNYTASAREGMKLQWKYDSAKRRFDGMTNNVKTIEDIDAISTELAGGEGMRDWQAEMMPQDYESLMNTLGSMRKSFNDAQNTNARAVLSSMEERTKSTPSLLPVNELKEMQELAAKTTDPSIRARAGRIMRSQEIIRQKQRLPVAELRAQKNAVMGNPGLAYPNLPVEVSNAVNKASETFGVSASLLGAMANREYGSEFAKARSQAKEVSKFKPNTVNNIDLRNMRSDVVDAVTKAGTAYGGPLTLTASGKGISTPQSGVNVVTVGMDGVEKAKIAASLVDAGFTGISEYDGYIQADMTQAVPKSFGDKEGKVWGGWTYLSPEVGAVLKEKGFVAGADSATIKRDKIGEPAPAVNYDAPTGIVDENGKPTSSARGLFQFTEGTWLSMIKDPNVAAAMGIDTANKTDAELLALRGDPNLSTMAAAAYAKKNEATLMNTLGRPVTEAELYMAHFMGAGGATTFLTAFQNNPEQGAATLMPETSKANKPVFYGKDGKELTVAQVYSNISQSFVLAPSKVAYEDAQVLDSLIAAQEKTLKEFPMQQAIDTGSLVVTPLSDENGFVSRGAQARAVADYYTIPMKDMKPFTKDEEAFIKKTVSEGSVDDNLALMANIQSMGDEPAKAALKQIGQTDGVFAHSADLFLNGDTVVAGDIVRGRKRMEENPAVIDQIGVTKTELSDEFTNVTGGALYDLEPARRQTIQDAATSLYVERMATGGGNMSRFDKTVYEKAVQDVMGAKQGSAAIADINGHPTFIPRGLTAPEVEGALQRMTIDDWTAMSETGEPPRYADGGIVDPRDIREEVMLRSIGGGQYKLMLDDGSFLTTGQRTPEGRMKWFIFVPDADRIRRISTRPVSTAAYQPVRGEDY